MNLHALRLFHVIASTGSVTRASELLKISQPAITAQIKKFEKELSLILLEPQGRGIRLTDAGDKIAALARGCSPSSSKSSSWRGITGRVRPATSAWRRPTCLRTFSSRPGWQGSSSSMSRSR